MFAYDRCCHVILLILTINIFGRLSYLLNKHRNWSMEKSNLPKATPTDLAKPESETVSRSVVSDLYHPMDCSPPGSSVHGFSRQEYRSGLPFPSPGESFWPRDWTQVSCTASRFLTFWGPRQHIKKQRQHFADTGPWSQSYGFSSSHLWVWELGHKEGWALKNWSFQTVVLEKTLESLLDSKEIQPVHPKGNQLGYSLEGLMLKLKLQCSGHLMRRADSLEKTLMLGKTKGKRRRGRQRMRWLDSITNSMHMNLRTLWQIVKDRGVWWAAVLGGHKQSKTT